jgi:hypothetical protein
MPEELNLIVGARYRVIREGAQLSGWRSIAPYTQQGWNRPLRVGEILRYEGLHYSGGSDGFDLEKFTPENPHHDYEAFAEFHPTADPADIWTTRPDPSYLERVD